MGWKEIQKNIFYFSFGPRFWALEPKPEYIIVNNYSLCSFQIKASNVVLCHKMEDLCENQVTLATSSKAMSKTICQVNI